MIKFLKYKLYFFLHIQPINFSLTNAAWHRKRLSRDVYKHMRVRKFKKSRAIRLKRSWDFDRSFYGKKFRYLNTGKHYLKLIKPLKSSEVDTSYNPVFGYDKLSDAFVRLKKTYVFPLNFLYSNITNFFHIRIKRKILYQRDFKESIPRGQKKKYYKKALEL